MHLNCQVILGDLYLSLLLCYPIWTRENLS